LHRLFQRAFRVAKQVRTHTDITRGAVSVGSVAVDLAVKIFGDLKTRKVLVLGAGETSERTARALVSRGVSDLRVTNRSGERAQQLAAQVGGCAIGFNGWENQCREIDILISSTAAEEPLLTREKLTPILRDRWDRPLFIIDIARRCDVDVDSLSSFVDVARSSTDDATLISGISTSGLSSWTSAASSDKSEEATISGDAWSWGSADTSCPSRETERLIVSRMGD
jgi:glutamyl-tRNA reductase